MKLILITDSAHIDGGISKVALDSALACARRGIDVHFVAACGPVDQALLDEPRIKTTCLNHLDLKHDPRKVRAALSGIVNFEMARTVRDILEKADPVDTVVHIHGWSKAVSPYTVRVAAKAKIKTILTIHEYFIACPNGAFYVYKDDEICHRKPLSADCLVCNCDQRAYSHKLWRFSRSLVQKHLFDIPELVKNYILLSPVSRAAVEPYLPADSKIYMLDNPISAEDRGRIEAEKNEKFLFVGRFSREKGVLRMAQAVHDLNLPAVFIGDGHLRDEMQRIAPHATFTGWQDHSGILEWMKKSRALIFPSTWYEGQPLVPIEAAANGIPCVLSNCNAAIDYLLDDQRGLQFQYDSLDSLKSKLTLMRDDALVERLSRNVYSWYWNDPWSIDRHADRLIDIYRGLLTGEAVSETREEPKPELVQTLA